MSWVQTAYLIAEVIAIPLTGFLLRVLSMRWLFVASVAVFTAASIGCAASGQLSVLIAWRVLQGFSGGTLIPAVFAAVFLLFPARRQALATTIAGVMAVSAPTAGPIAGGWITSTFSWHWLFLINVLPGILAILVAAASLPRVPLHLREARALDYLSLIMMALSLSALIIALKQAPERGWTSGLVIGLLALSVASSAGFARRTLRAAAPIVDLP
jgi:DHA2 family multidrug resistance protein